MQKIAIYTIDYLPERERLMPWRTVAEVAKYLHGQGHDVTILNGYSDATEIKDFVTGKVPVKGIRHSYPTLVDVVRDMEISTVAVPVTWRDGLKDWSAFKKTNCKKVAYFAGGVYRVQDALKLWRGSSLGISKPYLLESIVPKYVLTRKLADAGFTEVVGLTPYTAERVVQHPPLKVSYILPGKDAFEALPEDMAILRKYNLEGKKFLLYTGAPSPVRGSEWLLQAVGRIQAADFQLVMLMRTDVGSDFQRFEQKLKQLKHPERVVIVCEKLTREQLKAFFSHAYAMVLPFIVIPSEIPLTYYEALSCGTPVVTFSNGGTTQYLKGLSLARKSVEELARKMAELWTDTSLRKYLSQEAIACMSGHPNWLEVGCQWEQMLIDYEISDN